MQNKTVGRRSFIKQASLLTAGLAALQFPVWARSLFSIGYPVHNIPENKSIDLTWQHSLFNRGTATTYLKSRNELKYIGMPVGGLHAGTVYVGGDGRLWLWQIYNESFEGVHEGIDPKVVNWNDGTSLRKIRPRDGSAYVEPAIANNRRVLEQGFAVKISYEGKTIIKELNEDHWDEVSFQGSYPVATITYSSKGFPLEIQLNVYSPFIPLEAEKSALPATVLRVGVVNTSKKPIDISLLGWMENGVNKLTGKENTGQRKNTLLPAGDSTGIFFSSDSNNKEVHEAGDGGSMCFMLHHTKGKAQVSFNPWPINSKHFDASESSSALEEFPEKLIGAIGTAVTLIPGQKLSADYSVSWYFNNPNPKLIKLVKDAEGGFHYGEKFKDAKEVSNFINANFKELSSTTELWASTWKDSTLPHWFLERTFVNIGTLATANTYRFADGRFWSWEGVGACAGTCTHVWQYAQAMARIFPELERGLREEVDLGVGFVEESGAILFRGENETHPAIDGQAGTILRFYREHQMSKDSRFLNANWPKIKKAVQFMLAQDKNGDGMTDTPMENTLDAVWEGEIAWIVGLCIAAAKAAQMMAEEMKDISFAKICENYVSNGKRNMEKELFNGEYFIHRPDAVQGRQKLGSYNTCHIDQVYGQSWAFQVGLPRILDKEKTLAALRALWKYNFTLDVGPYIKTHTGGRPYALPGEGGMVMNTNPHNETKPFGENISWQLGYFHECMSGFEHQVAAHFMAEGMLDESLVLTRAIHDRHHAAKRNPFNEIECSDHYARAMASYGTFITACGFEYHGPKGYIGFAPKWNKENFKAAFTTAAGWGTYSQRKTGLKQVHRFELKYGELSLHKIALEKLDGEKTSSVLVILGGRQIPVKFTQENNALEIILKDRVIVGRNQTLIISIS
ncbi:GH116 family glycosyl-hydrolase [Pedobacter nutrimenti]|uniref:GH116 family glycosyl-hydrolase n=1 Tax=Pedobacter nutrimenti TaxID=1241337 RepID=UPI00293105CA|nr:GH116 family glycosyl-hydrolase [Pedobacter nutrimenti]